MSASAYHNTSRRAPDRLTATTLSGIEFATRKVTDGMARIKLGVDTTLELGNLHVA